MDSAAESVAASSVKRIGPLLGIGLLYAAIGFVTGELSQSAGSPQWQNLWRLSAWPLSLLVFVCHFALERLKLSNPTLRTARNVAIAAGLGGLLLAVVGPVRTHWGEADFGRATVLSVVLWPLLTGIPAFLLGWIGGWVVDRFRRLP